MNPLPLPRWAFLLLAAAACVGELLERARALFRRPTRPGDSR